MEIKLKNKILSSIKPTTIEQTEMQNSVETFIKKLKRSAKKLDLKISFFIGGSFGKNTYLKGKSDVDIFARFDPKYQDNLLSKYLEQVLLGAKLNYKKQKGSRDYFSIAMNTKPYKIIFEVVPNKYIENSSDLLNSTDVSPMHVDFLKEKLKDNSHLTDEIRLAKQFFKSKGLYGAESYIHGFSGHSIDILITHYKSLENLIVAAKTWDEQTFIDINKTYLNINEALDSIEKDKHSNLILVDPILKERNAARALSNEKYSEFILVANKIKTLSEKDFEVVVHDFKDIMIEVQSFAKENNLKSLIYKFRFDTKNDSEDIVGSKLLKLSKKINKYFEDLEFRVFLTDFHIHINDGEALFIYLFEKIDLPNIKKIIGPKVYMQTAVENFLKTRDYYFIEDSRVCIYEKRITHKIEDISRFDLSDFHKILNKNISFIKNFRRILK